MDEVPSKTDPSMFDPAGIADRSGVSRQHPPGGYNAQRLIQEIFNDPRAQQWFKGETRSGRPFHYETSEYRVRSSLTPDAALNLAKRIVREKYRESDWDRQHPGVDVQLELVFSFTTLILGEVARFTGAERVEPLWITSWGIAFDGELVEVVPDNRKAEAELRLRELIARDGGRYSLQPLAKIGFPPAAPI